MGTNENEGIYCRARPGIETLILTRELVSVLLRSDDAVFYNSWMTWEWLMRDREMGWG